MRTWYHNTMNSCNKCGEANPNECRTCKLIEERDLLLKQIEILKEAVENIKKHREMSLNKPELSSVWNIADRALQKIKEMEND